MEGLPHLWPFAQAWDSRAPSSTHAPVCSTAVPRPFSGSENVVRKDSPKNRAAPVASRAEWACPCGVWLLSGTVPRALSRAHRGTCLGHSGRRSPGIAGVGRAVRAVVQQGQGRAVRAPHGQTRSAGRLNLQLPEGRGRRGVVGRAPGTRAGCVAMWRACFHSFVIHSTNICRARGWALGLPTL